MLWEVTPCVGVWIETMKNPVIRATTQSHPAWVCGLKPICQLSVANATAVTPCVGVWIETRQRVRRQQYPIVTPCVGVWIETLREAYGTTNPEVTPCVGVWIETLL